MRASTDTTGTIAMRTDKEPLGWAGLAAAGMVVYWGLRRSSRSSVMVAAAALLAASTSRLLESRIRPRRAEPEPDRPEEEQRFGEGERDLVEEASWESFPASDPPAY